MFVLRKHPNAFVLGEVSPFASLHQGPEKSGRQLIFDCYCYAYQYAPKTKFVKKIRRSSAICSDTYAI